MTQKSDRGKSVVVFDKYIYIKHIESLLSGKAKLEMVDTKKGLLSFTLNREKHIDKYLKYLKSSGTLSVEEHRKSKAVGSRPVLSYGFCKVHEDM